MLRRRLSRIQLMTESTNSYERERGGRAVATRGRGGVAGAVPWNRRCAALHSTLPWRASLRRRRRRFRRLWPTHPSRRRIRTDRVSIRPRVRVRVCIRSWLGAGGGRIPPQKTLRGYGATADFFFHQTTSKEFAQRVQACKERVLKLLGQYQVLRAALSPLVAFLGCRASVARR